MLELPYPPALSASVDWFSASFRDDENRRVAHRLATVISDKYVQTGLKATGATWKGYSLTRVGHISYGIRDEDSYVELRGSGAADWWLSFAPWAHNVARMDLAVTWQPPKPRPGLAHGLYREVSRLPDRGHMPPQLRYFETFQGGQTMYVGSVKSDRMGRIYDKGMELKSHPPGAIWRYELQLRNEVAAKVAGTLLASNGRGEDIGAAVATFYRQRHTPCAWADGLKNLPIHVHRPASSDDIRREWLQHTVKPVLKNLAARWSVRELMTWVGLDGLDSRV